MVDSKVGNIIVCGKKRTLYVGNKGGIFYRSKGAKVYVNKKNVEDMMNFGGWLPMIPKSGSKQVSGSKQASGSQPKQKQKRDDPRDISPFAGREAFPRAPHAEAAWNVHSSVMGNAERQNCFLLNLCMRNLSNAISG